MRKVTGLLPPSHSGASTTRWFAQTANCQEDSGAYGIRTRDLLNAIEALYQLS